MAVRQDQDVVELLLDQHNQIKSLFSEISNAQGARKRELFEQLVRLLAVHETAEEIVVHPAARRETKGGEQVARQRMQEEDQAKRDLKDLYDMGVDHPDFDARLTTFAEAVIRHATLEENEEFTRLRREVPVEELRQMAGAVRAAESTAPTRPHPHSGEGALSNVVAGPPTAVFDRARDAVRDWNQSHGDGHR